MRVLLISTSYPLDMSDWRGIFMRHLIFSLARIPALKLRVWAPPGDLPGQVSSVVSPVDRQWLSQLMATGGISHLVRAGGWRSWGAPIRLLRMIGASYRKNNDVDVYHINWLQCALPLPNNHKPALITVLGNDMKLLKLPFMRQLLRRVMKQRKVVICPNAEWMQAPLHAAFGDLAAIQPVSFGIDPSWFAVERSPHDVCPPYRWIVVSRLTADKLGSLFSWSKNFFGDGSRELHLFGPMQEDIQVPSWIHYHGSATPEQLAKEWFAHACGLITLSRHAEGRPQVMLEAMAAGLPIIASNLQAHASILVDGETGKLCGSVEEFGAALRTLEDDQANQRLGNAAKRWVVREIGTWDDCAERYMQIYRLLLGVT